jgi:hypothetical protein
MTRRGGLGRLLGIKPGEGWIVFWAGCLALVLGGFSVVYFTAATTALLCSFDRDYLAWSLPLLYLAGVLVALTVRYGFSVHRRALGLGWWSLLAG